MLRSIKFHADENVDDDIITGLRNRKIDVTSSLQANLMGARDNDQLSSSVREQRMLITRDKDFLRIGSKKFEHFGIAFIHHELSVSECIKKLVYIFENRTQEAVCGQVVYLKSLLIGK